MLLDPLGLGFQASDLNDLLFLKTRGAEGHGRVNLRRVRKVRPFIDARGNILADAERDTALGIGEDVTRGRSIFEQFRTDKLKSEELVHIAVDRMPKTFSPLTLAVAAVLQMADKDGAG